MVRPTYAPEANHLKYGQKQLMNVNHGRSYAPIFRSQALEGPRTTQNVGLENESGFEYNLRLKLENMG